MSTTHLPARRHGSRAAALALLLLAAPAAGCSAGHAAATPPVQPVGSAADAGARTPRDLGPAGTLYVDGADLNVYAFPLGASGTVAPSRTITAHPNQAANEGIASIATLADGKLAILQRVAGNTRCRVVVEDADANGSPPASNVWCDPSATVTTIPTAVARNRFGGFDLLYQDNTNFDIALKRFGDDGATLLSTLLPATTVIQFTTGPNGAHDYALGTTGVLDRYSSTTTDPSDFGSVGTIAGSSFRAIAVAPDKTVYVAYGDAGSEVIVAVVNGAVTRTIGPIGHFGISSLAVDSAGELYVGLTGLDSSRPSIVRAYAPDANGIATPVRTITPSPQIFCACNIAISE